MLPKSSIMYSMFCVQYSHLLVVCLFENPIFRLFEKRREFHSFVPNLFFVQN